MRKKSSSLILGFISVWSQANIPMLIDTVHLGTSQKLYSPGKCLMFCIINVDSLVYGEKMTV